MINGTYIHEYAPHDQFMYESHYALLDVKDAIQSILALETEIQDKVYFGESVDGELLVLEAEKKNVFERIGDAIISIFQAFVDAVKNIGKSIKESITGIRKKSSSDKMKNLMRENPEMAEKFLSAVMSGNIKANDIKNLDELVEEATKISNQLLNGKIDEKTFGEKMENALKKVSENARNIASIIGLVGTTVTAITAVRDFRTNNIRNQAQTLNAIDNINDQRSRDVLRRRFLRESEEFDVFEATNTSFSDVVNKVTSFCADHLKFFDSASEKLNGLKTEMMNKLKNLNSEKDTSIYNTIIESIRKVMGVLTKNLNSIKLVSNKVESKLSND